MKDEMIKRIGKECDDEVNRHLWWDMTGCRSCYGIFAFSGQIELSVTCSLIPISKTTQAIHRIKLALRGPLKAQRKLNRRIDSSNPTRLQMHTTINKHNIGQLKPQGVVEANYTLK